MDHETTPVTVRTMRPEDWPSMWAFMREIVAAGETYAWDTDLPEEQARANWTRGRTFVAVDADGAVMGTAESHANYGGPGGHVANAGFMVDPAYAGRGVARALCAEVLRQARADGFRAMVFNAVVETNTRAVALWESFGFAVLTTIPEAFHHPVHGYVGLHVMHRELA